MYSSTQSTLLLLPSLVLLLILGTVGIHGVGIGPCNSEGGTCINLSLDNGPWCYKADQIEVNKKDIIRECGQPYYICCKSNQIQNFAQPKCDAKTTFYKRVIPSRGYKRHGCLCQGNCDTLQVDGLCQGAACTCCVQKAKKCAPKSKYEDKGGFCVSKAKHCVKSGGTLINRGCDCKKGKPGHLCVTS